MRMVTKDFPTLFMWLGENTKTLSLDKKIVEAVGFNNPEELEKEFLARYPEVEKTKTTNGEYQVDLDVLFEFVSNCGLAETA